MNTPIEEILNDIEKASLAKLAEDLTTLNALKKLFLFGIYYNGTLKPGDDPKPLMNFATRIDEQNVMTDDQLGRVLRAKIEGLVTVELGFKELEKFKKVQDKTSIKNNQAR